MSGTRYNFTGLEIELPIIYSGGFHNFNYSLGLGKHVHETGPEITYVMKGFADWQVEGGVRLEQSGGTLAIVPRHVRHRGAEGIIAPCWLFWYVLDLRNVETSRRNTPFNRRELQLIFDAFSVKSGVAVQAEQGLDRHFTELLDVLCRGKKNPWYELEMRLILCRIILDTAKSFQKAGKPANDLLAGKARAYMKKNLADNILLDDIAAACGLSKSQFSRRFKQAAGITAADCLQRMRIEEACRLLGGRNADITEIAFKLGFSSSQYFSTVFKRYTGMTPCCFRKK
ncbi:MAG: helix-turn-helix domain-containing protein [Victivallaceae bacterium]|nr:helix-turn-helix domain-containing protein [Victivallaceae bacterium]